MFILNDSVIFILAINSYIYFEHTGSLIMWLDGILANLSVCKHYYDMISISFSSLGPRLA